MSTSEEKKSSLAGSATTVSVATAGSRILGLIREQVMAYFFGAGMATDAFVTAFRIPNLLRDLFAEGALSSAFVPIFKERLVTSSKDDAFKMANVVITAILIVVGLVVLLGIIASPALIYLFAHGFTDDAAKFDLTVSLTQVMMAYLLLVSLSALIMGMLNSFGRFGIPAISPAMFNIGTILVVYGFYEYFDQPIYTMAIGVLVGGLGQILIQLPALLRIGYRFRFSLNIFDAGLRRIGRLITPMIIGLSAGRINILTGTMIASFLVEGTISYLNYSYRLMHFPLGVFAVAIGTVALPRVAEQVARHENKEVGETFLSAFGLNSYVVIPSAVFLALLGQPIVDLIYQWGAFSELDSERTALTLLHYSYGLIGFAVVRVVVPFFYAYSDSRTPMKISLLTVLVNLLLYWPMIKLLDFAGLAAATSLAALLNGALLVYLLPKKGVEVPFARLASTTLRILVASLAAWGIARFLPYGLIVPLDNSVPGRLLALALPSVIGLILYIVFSFAFRIREISLLKSRLLRKRQTGK